MFRFPDRILRFPDKILRFSDQLFRFPDRILKFPDKILRFPDRIFRFQDQIFRFTGKLPASALSFFLGKFFDLDLELQSDKKIWKLYYLLHDFTNDFFDIF